MMIVGCEGRIVGEQQSTDYFARLYERARTFLRETPVCLLSLKVLCAARG